MKLSIFLAHVVDLVSLLWSACSNLLLIFHCVVYFCFLFDL